MDAEKRNALRHHHFQGRGGCLLYTSTGENGLASFLVADFVPTSNRRVTLDVVVTHSQHNTREMRRLTLRGGQAEIVRLEKYTGVPYLRMACYNGSDIVVQQNTIYYTAKNDAQQTIDVIFTNPGKKVLTCSLYLIYQTYDENGSLKETEESRKLTTDVYKRQGPVGRRKTAKRARPGSRIWRRIPGWNFRSTPAKTSGGCGR